MINRKRIKRLLQKLIAPIYRINLKNRDFSIISNNCWGGGVYDRYNLQYKSPTIGLWISPIDYLKFVNNLEYYINQELIQISWKESHVKEILECRKEKGIYKKELAEMIIGRIDDVDIVFLHYNSFVDAKDKWNRRKKRINFENLIVKMNDQNGATRENLMQFLNTDYKNKLVFTADESLSELENVVYVKKYADKGFVVEDIKSSFELMNVTRYLNDIRVVKR